MKVRDYLRSHEALLLLEGHDTRVRVDGLDIVIRRMPQIEIRKLLNEATALMLDRLERNLHSSRLAFEQRPLEELSLRIALHNLYLYMMWDGVAPKYRGALHPLEPADLLKCHVAEQVMLFCRKTYGAGYRGRAAALLGYSEREFSRWEAQRPQLRMCTDNARYRVA
ncbi:hypothetical protein [Pseudomonas schmalbachii]|uniref:Uncharacterized protein n=1 Tax=Pseudomonas schmalbachii TaxID=2816993 RepID=A0ABS3TT88_9PSED|nr:hypothetical protein [Pseudomonas schmalbachii]MBO3276882.1 hypothetical protein [Pseudomonas schmalbachii]